VLSRLTPRTLLAATCVLSFAAVAAALVSQHVFGMLPCPWCILQRVIFIAIGVLAALGWALKAPLGRKLLAALAAALAASGVAAAWYQHTVATKSYSCNLTAADRIIEALRLETAVPFLFRIEASCADAAVDLLGLPYEYWSGALFALLFVLLVVAVLKKAR
jgi:protein dithiol:quinone oxidoreductase